MKNKEHKHEIKIKLEYDMGSFVADSISVSIDEANTMDVLLAAIRLFEIAQEKGFDLDMFAEMGRAYIRENLEDDDE